MNEFDQLWAPEPTRARKSVEALLLERGVVNEEQLAQARTVAAQTPGKSLAQILLTMSAASEAQILSAQAETMGLEFFTPGKDGVDAINGMVLPSEREAVLSLASADKKMVLYPNFDEGRCHPNLLTTGLATMVGATPGCVHSRAPLSTACPPNRPLPAVTICVGCPGGA